MPKKYKFRAECQYDANEFLKKIYATGNLGEVQTTKSDFLTPDVVVTIEVKRLNLRNLVFLAHGVPDSHVITETIALDSDYTGIRV